MTIIFKDGSSSERYGVTSWKIEDGWLVITAGRSTVQWKLDKIQAVHP